MTKTYRNNIVSIKTSTAQKRNHITFGKHLTIDAYGCDYEILNNMETIFVFLDTLPEQIGMHKIITPYVIKCAGNGLKKCDVISGFDMIAESYSSMQKIKEKKYLTMDLYSCNRFDHQKVITIVKNTFRYESLEKHILKRGLKFPTDVLTNLQ